LQSAYSVGNAIFLRLQAKLPKKKQIPTLSQIIGNLVTGNAKIAVSIISLVGSIVGCAKSPEELQQWDNKVVLIAIRIGNKVIGCVHNVVITNLQVGLFVDSVIVRDLAAVAEDLAWEPWVAWVAWVAWVLDLVAWEVALVI